MSTGGRALTLFVVPESYSLWAAKHQAGGAGEAEPADEGAVAPA